MVHVAYEVTSVLLDGGPVLPFIRVPFQSGERSVEIRIEDATLGRAGARVSFGNGESRFVCAWDVFNRPAAAANVTIGIEGDGPGCAMATHGRVTFTFSDAPAPDRFEIHYEGSMMTRYCSATPTNVVLGGCIPVAGWRAVHYSIRDETLLDACAYAVANGKNSDALRTPIRGEGILALANATTTLSLYNLPLWCGSVAPACDASPPGVAGAILLVRR